jgi:hypothetical protein
MRSAHLYFHAGMAHSRVKDTVQNAGSASFNLGNIKDVDVN